MSARVNTIFLIVVFSLLAPSRAWPQLPLASASPAPTQPASPALSPEDAVKAARLALDKERAELAGQQEAAQQAGNEEAAAAAGQQIELLNMLDLLYMQQLSAVQRTGELEAEKKRVDSERRAVPKIPADADFQTLERLREELRNERERLAQESLNARGAESAAAAAAALLQEKESSRRKAKEAVDAAADAAARSAAEIAYRIASLESRIQRQLSDVRTAELRNIRLLIETAAVRIQILQERIELLRGRVKLSEAGAKAQLAGIEAKEKNLRQRLEETKAASTACEKQYYEAKKRAGAAAPDPALEAEIEAYRLCRMAAQEQTGALSARLAMLFSAREIWSRRLIIAEGKASSAQLSAWLEELEFVHSAAEQRLRVEEGRKAELRAEIKKLGQRLEEARSASPSAVPWIIKHRNSVRRAEAVYAEFGDEREHLRSIAENLKDEIAERRKSRAFRDGIKAFWHAATEVWTYELFSVDDHPITVNKIFIALIIVVIGFRASFGLSRKFAQKVLPRLGLKPGEAAAFEALVFYALVVFFVLFALQVVHVPLTVFTLLGGAVAIGIGFGSQNIMNNFISGLILLIERPIRTGDMVEVDGFQGRVLRIGARSTRIVTFNNIDLVVPNSLLLEKTVVNWTLSDEMARSKITIGAGYDSDPQKVIALLLQAVEEQESVLREPAPYAALSDFSESSLVFQVYFWLSLTAKRIRPLVESDIRCRIKELFAASGISIPYPQRDIHLSGSAENLKLQQSAVLK